MYAKQFVRYFLRRHQSPSYKCKALYLHVTSASNSKVAGATFPSVSLEVISTARGTVGGAAAGAVADDDGAGGGEMMVLVLSQLLTQMNQMPV